MRIVSLICALTLLGGCEKTDTSKATRDRSAAVAALNRIDMVRDAGGSAAELCAEYEKAMDGMLQEGDNGAYRTFRAGRDRHCQAANALREAEQTFEDADRAAGDFLNGRR